MNGYWGIAIYQPKSEENWGTVLRSAYNFGASFVSTIGHGYRRQASDTVNATKHIPCFHYTSVADFLAAIPPTCILVPVEVEAGLPLERFSHPKQAIYVFGGEARTLPTAILAHPRARAIHIATNQCLNLAVCASIVMYTRAVGSHS